MTPSKGTKTGGRASEFFVRKANEFSPLWKSNPVQVKKCPAGPLMFFTNREKSIKFALASWFETRSSPTVELTIQRSGALFNCV